MELVFIKNDFFFSFLFRSKKSKRSRSRERKHRRSRSRSHSRSRSPSERRRHRREERYEREREREAREMREKELEKERLREIALEFKQSGAFSSITQQSQSFQLPEPILPFPTFNSFPVIPPVVEIPQQPPREMSQAYLEAVEASKRIVASKNFVDAFSCSNSNDSTSNGPSSLINEGSSNSSEYNEKKLIFTKLFFFI